MMIQRDGEYLCAICDKKYSEIENASFFGPVTIVEEKEIEILMCGNCFDELSKKSAMLKVDIEESLKKAEQEREAELQDWDFGKLTLKGEVLYRKYKIKKWLNKTIKRRPY